MSRKLPWAAWAVGLVSVAVIIAYMDALVVQPVNYGTETLGVPRRIGPYVPHLLVGMVIAWLLWRRMRPRALDVEDGARRGRQRAVLASAIALAVPTGLAAALLMGAAPSYIGFCAVVVSVCFAVDRLGDGLGPMRPLERLGTYAPAIVLLGILVSTLWHTFGQIELWRHFALGYADFGFFTTELEHCLPWKDVGPLRFSDTRMGYHAVFMFYGLAPLYAVFRTPVFLMVMATLLLNLAAIPFYQLGQRRSGSAGLGLVVALSWLALPSLTRLPYSNTYGFQSIYLAVPWLAFCFSEGLAGRWRTSHLCLAAALLCEETVCGVAFGWGFYLAVFAGRRRDGLIIMVAALAYLLLCTTLIIPAFASGGDYSRMQLFGEHFTVSVAFERLLLRGRAACYVLALVTPMAVGLVRGWKLALAALPVLVLVLLMENPDYLSLRGWHHSTILPALFAAAVCGVTGNRRALPAPPRGAPVEAPTVIGPHACGPVLALLLGSLWMHWLLGASPLAQAWRVHAAQRSLREPDPRLRTVEEIRARYAPSQYVVLATERMAAHFIDYRMVRPAGIGVDLDALTDEPHLLVFDHADTWDRLNSRSTPPEEGSAAWLERARAAGFTAVMRRRTVDVLVRPTPNGR